MSAARAAARNKPVIVVKAGRAPAGRSAPRPRTPARWPAPTWCYDAAIRARRHAARRHAAGAVRGGRDAGALSRQPQRRALAILTNGGGAGVMAADAAALAGVPLAELGDATLAAARRAAAGHLVARQPGRHHRRRAGRALRRQRCRRCSPTAPSGAVLFMHAPTAIVPQRRDRARLRAAGRAAAPAACWPAGWATARWPRRAGSSRTPASPSYETPEEAVRAFVHAA